MSELKALESATAVIEKVYLVYRKAEADKVIADLEESHKMEVEQLLILNREQAISGNKLRDSMEQALRYQKFKRCLAMANWCASEAYIHEHGSDYDEDLVAWSGKWHKRWLELANKFKEASRGTH